MRLRAWVLGQEPLCRPCSVVGRTTAAAEVDHVVPLAQGGSNHPSNLQPICSPCHVAKTNDQLGHATRMGHDVTGAPLDPNHHWNR